MKKYKFRKWFKKNFLLIEEVKRIKGFFVEVGGPTKDGFDLIDYKDIRKRIFISNITKGVSEYDTKTGEFLGYFGKIDFLIDGRHLPFKDNSIGIIFASYLPHNMRMSIWAEIFRVMRNNGLLIWQGYIEKEKIEKLMNDYKIEIVAYSSIYRKEIKKYFRNNIIFKKHRTT